MAAAGAPPSTFSAICANPDFWDTPNPAHASVLNVLGSAAATTAPEAKAALVAFSTHSPCVMALSVADDLDNVYFVHSPTLFAPDPTRPCPALDGLVVTLSGDDLRTAVPMVLPNAAFGRSANTSALQRAEMVGAAGYADPTGPVIRFGPHAGGAPHTDVLRARSFFVMPAAQVAAALTTCPEGIMGNVAFYQTFLLGDLESGDADRVRNAQPLLEWFRLHSTTTAVGPPIVGAIQTPTVAPGSAINTRRLNEAVRKVIDPLLTSLGAMGPALTTAAFNTGMTAITNCLNTNQTQHEDFITRMNNKTFTMRHGDDLAIRVRNWTGAGADADLPGIHKLLAKSQKGRDYGIIGAALDSRTKASPVALTVHRVPLASTKIVDDVFRSFKPAGNAQIYGQGLTPFAIVCEGHAEAAAVQKQIRQAETVESGGHVSLSDATALVTLDLAFAGSVQVGTEKLYGWSVYIDVFHGVNHDIAAAVRNSVMITAPLLSSLWDHYGDDAVARDYLNRVLYEYQAEYFKWVRLAATNPNEPVPTFAEIEDRLSTQRYDGLNSLPASWYLKMGAPLNSRRLAREQVEASVSTRSQSGSASQTAAQPNPRLISRFASSGHSSISGLMEGHNPTIPQHNGKPVCLTWALKGVCSTSCKRKSNHVVYPPGVVNKLHVLMDTCGVAQSRD